MDKSIVLDPDPDLIGIILWDPDRCLWLDPEPGPDPAFLTL
jgi:hypothetical protein